MSFDASRTCFFQDEDETSFAQEMTVPRSYSDGNLVRSVSWEENLNLKIGYCGNYSMAKLFFHINSKYYGKLICLEFLVTQREDRNEG